MAAILKIDPLTPQVDHIARVADLLRAGEVVGIPTDTFYGLAANPFDITAVEKVFAIKGRPKSNPLLLLIDSIQTAESLGVDLPPAFRSLAGHFWPGPLTIVVKATPKLPPEVTAFTGTIGLRFPRAAIATALASAIGLPITATSANLSGQPDCASAAQVQKMLGDRLPLIVDGGPSLVNRPSTVVSVVDGTLHVIREGAISKAEIEGVSRG
jgi:L-threonylcarbamoyladenylate synthase